VDPSRPLPRAALTSWPRARGRHVVLAVTALTTAAATTDARAEGPAAKATPFPDDEALDPAAGVARPAAADTRAGHVYLDAKVDVVAPVGVFSPGTPSIPRVQATGSRPAIPARAAVPGTATSDILGTGARFGGVIGYGIGRNGVLEANGAYTRYAGGVGCTGCAPTSFDLGIGFSYHLAQGVAIDPWSNFGLGFRQTTFTSASVDAAGKTTPLAYTYRGLDIARLGLGADFYPAPTFGLGLYFEAAVGTNVSQAAPVISRYSLDTPLDPGGRGFYGFLHVGLRLAFDPLRSGSLRPRGRTASRADALGN
jgi:hypothetical protein